LQLVNVTILHLTHDLFPVRLGNDYSFLKIDAASIHKRTLCHSTKGHNLKSSICSQLLYQILSYWR